MKNELVNLEIKDKIYTIRNQQVMLDMDLAELYQVEIKRLNEAVKRNIERFPEDFMFQLATKETLNLKSQNATSISEALRSQIATTKMGRGGRRYLPYAFTEQGVAMLAGVLRSSEAIKVNIGIMRAFVGMRRFLAKNFQLFERVKLIEIQQLAHKTTLLEHDKKFEEVFNAIESKEIKPKKGIFFDGQVFDAYRFVSDLIRSAKMSLILIDNYIDDTVLTLFSKRKKDVKVTILTKNISTQLQLDIEKYNSQYPKIEIKQFTNSHDRFLIIDEKEVYHFGASLKDLGKKWFAFSRFESNSLSERIKKEF